ncbi:hypothetical protein FQN49_005408 [Arthroderma sp. PD_2]|nr:hypothetical protein FQN49_005408 [Arthroderma sp. PD_2]
MLRAASAPVWSQGRDSARARWAGVFGPFAVGEQNDYSYVNVVAVYHIDGYWDELSREPRFEQTLAAAWGRKVSVTNIDDTHSVDIDNIEPLLCSRTIFGSDKDPLVARMRREAWDILDNQTAYYKTFLRDIKDIRAVVLERSKEEFCADTRLRQTVLKQIMAILYINTPPVSSDLSTPSRVVEDCEQMQRKISGTRKCGSLLQDTSSGQSNRLWEIVWDLATEPGDGTLQNLSLIIEQSWPEIEEEREKVERFQTLVQKKGL